MNFMDKVNELLKQVKSIDVLEWESAPKQHIEVLRDCLVETLELIKDLNPEP